MSNRINPYQRLLNEIRDHCRNIKYRHRTTMWVYPKAKLNDSVWNLLSLYERTASAEQLGYEVVLEAKEDGLQVVYRKKVPDTPFDWQ